MRRDGLWRPFLPRSLWLTIVWESCGSLKRQSGWYWRRECLMYLDISYFTSYQIYIPYSHMHTISLSSTSSRFVPLGWHPSPYSFSALERVKESLLFGDHLAPSHSRSLMNASRKCHIFSRLFFDTFTLSSRSLDFLPTASDFRP